MSSPPAPTSTLCLACGLCCDGTLFTAVPLTADDAARLGVSERRLPQPCVHLEARCCQAYERRPLACRRFDCNLVHALRDGEVDLPGALAIVAEAQRRVDQAVRAAGLRGRAEVVTATSNAACGDAVAYLQFHFTRLAGPRPLAG